MKNAVPSQKFKSLCVITDHSKSILQTQYQSHCVPTPTGREFGRRLKVKCKWELGCVQPQELVLNHMVIQSKVIKKPGEPKPSNFS